MCTCTHLPMHSRTHQVLELPSLKRIHGELRQQVQELLCIKEEVEVMKVRVGGGMGIGGEGGV